jgi:sugar transferase (PEP-CTERM/EpsH1 system associated)
MSHEPLLLLVHRIPYPPNKGDKIRSFHLLDHLARHYRVHLGTFVDDPADLAYIDELAGYCADLHAVRLHPKAARLRALAGLASGAPLTVPFYRSRTMARWVVRTVQTTGCRRMLAFSAAMAQYLPDPGPGGRRILDLVDVDSDKWRQYGEHHGGAMGWIYRREARRLLAYERRQAAAFDATVLVSAAEAALFRELAPEAAERIEAVPNGVDTEFFSPERDYPDPYPDAGRTLVFTGAMDYWANEDAVAWFAEAVLPLVRERVPGTAFYIVGSRPTERVEALGELPGVTVTGAVRDIRPYLAHAALAVAPLRVARGIQNKVLEAFAMDRPVLATAAALDGLELGGGYPLQAEAPEGLAAAAAGVLGGEAPAAARRRDWVRRRYDWSAHMGRFRALIEGETGVVSAVPANQPVVS